MRRRYGLHASVWNDLILVFGPIVSGTCCFPFGEFILFSRLWNFNTATSNSSGGYMIHITLNSSAYLF
jgi:hypothetical protein